MVRDIVLLLRGYQLNAYSQLIRVRSKDGTFRFNLEPTTTVNELAHKVRHRLGLAIIMMVTNTLSDS